ncbi:hypothetical protein RBB78_23755 [Tunturiibacter empetritectus]|uniref:hypothetical protein n=1 Tax=Tunturiibacter empetritectus TaxID=3069691 RepID=UPI003D9AF786
MGPENKARAEEYCWGREFVDLATDFPRVVTDPQQLFNILQRLTPRMYSIASSQAMHKDNVQTTVRVVRYEAHGRDRQGWPPDTSGTEPAKAPPCRSSSTPTTTSASPKTPPNRSS